MSENKQVKNRPPLKKTLTNVIVFASALLLLLFAFISPISFAEVEVDSNDEYTLELSMLDGVRFFVSSLRSLSAEELEELEYFEEDGRRSKNDSISEQFYDSDESNKSFKKLFMLTLMHQNSELRFATVANTLIGITYVTVCIVVFVIALISLFVSLISGKTLETAANKAERGMLLALLLLPVALLSSLQLANFGYSKLFLEMRVIKIGAAFGFYALLLLLLAVNAWIIYNRIWESGMDARTIISRFGIKEIISMICVIILVISAFLPSMSVTIGRTKKNKTVETTEHIYGTDMADFDDRTRNYYKNISEDETREIFDRAWDEKNSRFESVADLLGRSLVRNAASSSLPIYIFKHLITLISLIICASILVRQSDYILKRTRVATMQKAAKIWLTLFTVASFVLSEILLIIANGARTTWDFTDVRYELTYELGISPVLSLICVILICFALGKEKEITNKPSYDNPDVSYAPYVVK